MPRVSCTSRFQRVHDVWHIMKLCRFNLLLPLLVGLFLVIVPNGQEVLVRMDMEEEMHRRIWFGLMLILWPITTWYWARVILAFEFPDWPPRLTVEDWEDPLALEEYQGRLRWIFRWQHLMPRLCGIFALAMMFWAVWLASEAVVRRFDDRGWLIWFVFISMIAFTMFVWQRRNLMIWIKEKTGAVFAPSMAAHSRAGLAFTPLTYSYRGGRAPDDVDVVLYRTWRELPWSTVLVLGLSLAIFSFLPFFLFRNADRAVYWAPSFGSATILLLAASGWTCFGAWVMYIANQYRLPIFLLAFIWVALVSVGNDNHPVRTVHAPAVAQHYSFDQHLEAWLDQQPDKTSVIPMIVVSAEGGGIRAAYWTASVLSQLHAAHPQFASHVFAISGVSGGSLGAAVFNALLVEESKRSPGSEAPTPCFPAVKAAACARAMLRYDFVAAVFGMMLYPDLVQRFLWFPINAWDRATALETGWEQAWSDIVDHDHGRYQMGGLGQPFDALWEGKDRYTIPGLILNSTSVEEGKRVLLSNIPMTNDGVNDCLKHVRAMDRWPFFDVIDLRIALNPEACYGTSALVEPFPTAKTLSLTGAVHNSARFSFISPPGAVSSNLHVVDGGYFDNSGATTAEELLAGIAASNAAKKYRLQPILIHIANKPDPVEITGVVMTPARNGYLTLWSERSGAGAVPLVVRFDAMGEEQAGKLRNVKMGDRVTVLINQRDNVIELKGPASEAKSRYLAELFTPVITAYKAWSGQSSFALSSVHRSLEPRNAGNKPCPPDEQHDPEHHCPRDSKSFFQFRLAATNVELPLGWALSKVSWEEMDRQLEQRYFFAGCTTSEHEEGLYAFLLRCWPDLELQTQERAP